MLKLSWFSFLGGAPSLAEPMVGMKEVAEMLGGIPAVSQRASGCPQGLVHPVPSPPQGSPVTLEAAGMLDRLVRFGTQLHRSILFQWKKKGTKAENGPGSNSHQAQRGRGTGVTGQLNG